MDPECSGILIFPILRVGKHMIEEKHSAVMTGNITCDSGIRNIGCHDNKTLHMELFYLHCRCKNGVVLSKLNSLS